MRLSKQSTTARLDYIASSKFNKVVYWCLLYSLSKLQLQLFAKFETMRSARRDHASIEQLQKGGRTEWLERREYLVTSNTPLLLCTLHASTAMYCFTCRDTNHPQRSYLPVMILEALMKVERLKRMEMRNWQREVRCQKLKSFEILEKT